MKEIIFKGVIAAHLMPFRENLEIDMSTLRSHINYLAGLKLGGITCNGHSSEVASLTAEERQQSIATVLEVTAYRVPVICGIYADSTNAAIAEAKMALKEGADGLLIFPSDIFQFGGSVYRPEMVYRYFAAVADAVDLPIVLFSYGVESGKNYPLETIVKICSEINNVIAVKELSYDIGFYESLYRRLKELPKNISVLSSFSKHLLATLAVGADGLLSGHGSIVPEYQISIFEAVQNNDLFEARRIADKMWPIVKACYRAPGTDMHNRMKYVAKQLGRFPCEAVRPPLLPLSDEEKRELDRAVTESGLK
jgi:4-hydroxy-tetrahydrodipicolinate synthase